MPKNNTIYIHLGPHKTGTSFLQKLLHTNHSFLLSKKICVPKDYSNLTYILRSYIKEDNYKSEKYLREFFKLSSKYNKTIIVAEGLSSFSKDEVQKLVSFISPYYKNIIITITIREHVDQFKSSISQYLRSGLTIDKILQKKTISYKNIIQNWSHENIKVTLFAYDKNQFIEDFFKICSIPNYIYKNITKTAVTAFEDNRSLSYEAMMLLNEINKISNQKFTYAPIVYFSLKDIGNKSFTFTEQDFEKLWQSSNEDRSFLKKNDISFEKKKFKKQLADSKKSDYLEYIDNISISLAKKNFQNEVMSKYLEFVIKIHLDKFKVKTFKHNAIDNIINVINENSMLKHYNELIYQSISLKSVMIKYMITLKEKLKLVKK